MHMHRMTQGQREELYYSLRDLTVGEMARLQHRLGYHVDTQMDPGKLLLIAESDGVLDLLYDELVGIYKQRQKNQKMDTAVNNAAGLGLLGAAVGGAIAGSAGLWPGAIVGGVLGLLSASKAKRSNR